MEARLPSLGELPSGSPLRLLLPLSPPSLSALLFLLFLPFRPARRHLHLRTRSLHPADASLPPRHCLRHFRRPSLVTSPSSRRLPFSTHQAFPPSCDRPIQHPPTPSTMLRRLPSLLLVLATLLVLASASPAAAPVAAAAAEGVSPAPGFQLDLSRRFSSTVAALKNKKRGPTKTSKAGIKREMSVSDKLLAMLKSATNVLSPAASGSASPRPSASSRPRPSASAAAPSAWASHAANAAAAAQPSGSLHPSSVKAAKANVEYVKRKIQEEPWETLDSRLLCPIGETACPIFPRMGTYECLDTNTELESCGGCLSKGNGEDCTTIRGAQGVTCSSGACFVFTCQPGWKLDDEFKRQNGGKGRCKRVGPAGKEKRGLPAGERAVEESA